MKKAILIFINILMFVSIGAVVLTMIFHFGVKDLSSSMPNMYSVQKVSGNFAKFSYDKNFAGLDIDNSDTNYGYYIRAYGYTEDDISTSFISEYEGMFTKSNKNSICSLIKSVNIVYDSNLFQMMDFCYE